MAAHSGDHNTAATGSPRHPRQPPAWLKPERFDDPEFNAEAVVADLRRHVSPLGAAGDWRSAGRRRALRCCVAAALRAAPLRCTRCCGAAVRTTRVDGVAPLTHWNLPP